MLERDQPLAIYMEGNAIGFPAKMGHGVIRYSPNPIACVIDSTRAGQEMRTLASLPRAVPIVSSVGEARALGAEVLVLGTAPGGGLVPPEWYPAIDEAVAVGMSVLNGLHDRLAPRYPNLAPGQWIWDVRVEPPGLQPAEGRARFLTNRRLLMIGTDMAVGKMTSGLEIHRVARQRGIKAEFVATGQIGITVTGRGIPLDAIRLDFAGGAVEAEVLRYADAELVVIEGQGSLIHPASSANLPLLRGAFPTHLVLCHRAGQKSLRRSEELIIPPLREVIQLYELVGEACGVFPRPKTVAVALNTFETTATEADEACRAIEGELGIPCVDPVRHGADRLVDAVMA
ncbi:DUF1611 domain-containing protein [Fimbriimonas ginsengisoli]|uniref:DUF1611 domain-containing protein n=1 Tax=Fimbriimonas ginsengisoli Gsoil 348 TaxID=661478 RepID=A0A068NR38_FIMGI|nr:DUF1611 domain-containing protein [Fimbriimonas ginsengisoli]AIE85220.1 hypothetical protein OP10G_1852 [Fimbriimonas ginsengisoli Gsoil 348]